MEDFETALNRVFATISDPASKDPLVVAMRPLLRSTFEAGANFTLNYVNAAYRATADALAQAVRGGESVSPDLFNARPIPPRAPHSPIIVKKRRKPAATRAAKGRIAEILQIVLTKNPGCTTSEAERLGLMLDSQIAIKSVGNELRRGRGTTYRKNGSGWFLISDEGNEAAGKAVEANPAASITLNHGGADATTIAA